MKPVQKELSATDPHFWRASFNRSLECASLMRAKNLWFRVGGWRSQKICLRGLKYSIVF